MSRSLLSKEPPATESERQVALVIRGWGDAGSFAWDLVTAGIEFHVEPLPEDEWEFTVKHEALKTALDLQSRPDPLWGE